MNMNKSDKYTRDSR